MNKEVICCFCGDLTALENAVILSIRPNIDAEESQDLFGNYMAKSFILETHSELFVLQLKRLVQKGILKPEDVSINLVERNKKGNSEIHNIPVNTQGGFEKKWPGGFFTERMEILTS